MSRKILTGWVCVLGCMGWVGGTTYYVDDSATGANDGSSWTDAFADLQVALDIAIKGDEIRVGQGTYRPTVSGGDRAISFVVPDGVTLLGGYAGVGADDPGRRDIAAYVTVLSGDLNGDDLPVNNVSELLESPSRQDNSYHVVQTLYVYPSAATTIGGFTITGGNANGEHYTQQNGGGIEVGSHSMFIRDCQVVANSAIYSGGGIEKGNVWDCRIRFNYAKEYGGGVSRPLSLQSCLIEGNLSARGGGMNGGYNEMIYTGCEFRDNEAAYGGAVYIGNDLLAFDRCDFVGNRSTGNGGAIYIMNNCTCLSNLTMFRCRLVGNRSGDRGGAIYHEGNPRAVLYSCLIQGNQADGLGGGIYSLTYEGMRDMGYLGVTNCTIVGNKAAQTGGIWFCSATTEFLDVVNTIIWGNLDLLGVGQLEGQIRISVGCGEDGTGGNSVPPTVGAPLPVRYSCIEGLTAGYGGEGNIGADPMFIPSMGPLPNYHVTAESPCINAGTNAAYPCMAGQPNPGTGTWVDPGDLTCSAGMTDLDGLPRIRGGIVDMGAYEFQTAVGMILYVDDSAPGLQDGSSWGDAFTDLQDALAVAKAGQEIRVAQGTYRPADPNGSRDASFVLGRPGLKVLGGFAGFGSGEPDRRDVAQYETILSGDLMSDDEPLVGPYDSLQIPSRKDNSHHVVQFKGLHGDSAVLDGFTITGGQADISYTDVNRISGGGILIHNTSPVIGDCTVRENVAYYGAGIENIGNAKIIGCRILNNIAEGGTGIENGRDLVVEDCLIAGNLAAWSGAGIGNGGKLLLKNSRIVANTSSWGAGLTTVYAEDTTIDRCVFHLNQADQGSAIYGNVENDRVVLTNSIVWNNPCSEGVAIYLGDDHQSSHAWISYCDIEGGKDGVLAHHGYELEIGPGILNADPMFADTENGDYHLKSQAGRWDAMAKAWVQDAVTSPCIDAGDPAAAIMYEPFPNGGVVNIGAYGGTAEASKSYFGKPVCEVIVAGDINGDCKVDLSDFAIMAGHWLETH